MSATTAEETMRRAKKTARIWSKTEWGKNEKKVKEIEKQKRNSSQCMQI
jgi:hypothetical protein